jgi:hypothetical protein
MRPLALAGPVLGLALIHLAPPAATAAGPVQAQAVDPHINCTCRANGRSYAVGERVCLSTPTGRRVAECRMQQNVTSWTLGPDDCSESVRLLAPTPLRG